VRDVIAECGTIEQVVFFEKPAGEAHGISLADLERTRASR